MKLIRTYLLPLIVLTAGCGDGSGDTSAGPCEAMRDLCVANPQQLMQHFGGVFSEHRRGACEPRGYIRGRQRERGVRMLADDRMGDSLEKTACPQMRVVCELRG